MSEVIVVGGGISGLTAAAYLSKAGYKPLLLEKESKCGGLVNSFERDGFTYDGGIRATENSGILFPMLKQLDLDLDFVKNSITLGIEDRVIHIQSEENISEYQELLNAFYPESKIEIAGIVDEIKRILKYMEVQYGIDNPVFLDFKEDRDYFIKEVVPWMVKYAFTGIKINKINKPVLPFLRSFTSNQALLDIITQHFFTDTPAFFALSYLKVYLDYYYPVGGTGTLPEKLTSYIYDNGGRIQNGTSVVSINPTTRSIWDDKGKKFIYDQLIWAADMNSLYRFLDIDALPPGKEKKNIAQRIAELKGKVGNNSVLTLYLAVELSPDYFSEIASEHFFYTPKRSGESAAGPIPIDGDQSILEEWLKSFFDLSTYEISIPVIRDHHLAPEGKTGLIISILFDYHLVKRIREQGWYEEFKLFSQKRMIEVLNNSIYPGIKDKIIHQFCSTPLTLEAKTASTHGAITGWSFTNHPFPVENRLPKLFSATDTPITGIYQAGQWTYSPSGLPIAILTGKIAADRAIKNLKK